MKPPSTLLSCLSTLRAFTQSSLIRKFIQLEANILYCNLQAVNNLETRSPVVKIEKSLLPILNETLAQFGEMLNQHIDAWEKECHRQGGTETHEFIIFFH